MVGRLSFRHVFQDAPMNSSPAPGRDRLFLSVREQIADRIRNDVLCGRFAAGERLLENKLGEEFGVSRTPIREALQQLTTEGILEGRANTGVKVAPRPTDEMCDLIVSIRRTIEAFAVRSFFADLGEADFAHWNAILKRMRTACVAKDYAAIAELDIEFHRSIVRRARQRDLEAIWTSLIGRLRSHFRETQQDNYGNPLDIHAEHVQIVKAIRSGDVEAAVALLQEKIN
jgi:DNA-binding GntR family transcriptional regulator